MDPSCSLYDSDGLTASSPFHILSDFASEQSDFDNVEANFIDSYYDISHGTASDLSVVDSLDMKPTTCVSSSSSSPLNVPPYDTLSIVYDTEDLTTYEDYNVISPDFAQSFKHESRNQSVNEPSSNVALTQCLNTPIVSYTPNEDTYSNPISPTPSSITSTINAAMIVEEDPSSKFYS